MDSLSSKLTSYYIFHWSIILLKARKLAKLLKYHNRFEPELTTGDILIFPSNQLHGVFPHGSDEVRRTIAVNFDIIF